MHLSIVTTLYMSAPHLQEFHRRISSAAAEITSDFEIIFVNDGSPDDSLARALALLKQDSRIRIIDLSRNFGHHRAIMTGLSYARGEKVFLIDCDLEEPPELLGKFYERMRSSAVDVVYGQQIARKGGLWERLTGAAFYKIFNLFSTEPVPANLVTVRLMSSRYVRNLVEHRDREIFLAGLWHITGFQQVAFPVVKASKSGSTYNFARKVSILVNAITSFSNRPLVQVFYLGTFILLVSGSAALYLIVDKLFFGTFLFGWPSLIVSIWLMCGLIIFCLGVIGIYLSKIFMEVKDRPYTIVRDIYEAPPAD